MKEIENREDVSLIVRSFYAQVRTDETLAHIFNNIITDWEAHLEKLTDFWTMQLFGGKIYNGNPIKVHQEVDDQSNHEVTAYHFGTWLNLWFETIDANFTGENADTLKRRARKMQTVLMVSMYENRN
ncbi:group III truncated hemoglobin [Flavobacterium sp. PLA-1-15]|uniref:group III truncated hemoglobin n=1 Tax=Flavobacterium sp. PLA-1-15 TaxID=3380533 RepID=UPI003B76B70F